MEPKRIGNAPGSTEKYTLPAVTRPEVLQRAINAYGKDSQMDVAIEEMSELSKALIKYRRAEKSQIVLDREQAERSIYEETADVIVMLTQLLMIFGGKDTVQAYTESKVSRLEKRLQGEKG